MTGVVREVVKVRETGTGPLRTVSNLELVPKDVLKALNATKRSPTCCKRGQDETKFGSKPQLEAKKPKIYKKDRVCLLRDGRREDDRSWYEEAEEDPVKFIEEGDDCDGEEEILMMKINVVGLPLPRYVRSEDVSGAPIDRLLNPYPPKKKRFKPKKKPNSK